ncbi:MAG: NAD(P)/FAD-dependent oxidoreductase [Kiritimatiellales bacterium]|nr:NAD(P)/FAD-dependent oxidoreductase [Kiritimatiellales bacterium]
MEKKVDVVVIGAGAGGLTSAALLSKAGLNIVVAESQPGIGGYLACFERDGYRFNSSIEWLSECGPEGFARAVFDHIGPDFPHCPPLTKLFRGKNDATDYLLTDHPFDMRDQLIKEFPEDETGIRLLFDEAQKLGGRLRGLTQCVQSAETMSLLQKFLHHHRMAFLGMPMIRFVRAPIDKALTRYFSAERARQLFCSQESLMSVIVPIAWAFTGNYQKCPAGGSEVIAQWLYDIVKEAGSEILVGCRVDGIELDDYGAACGVRLEDGRVIAAKYVIAACDLLSVYESMLPAGAVRPGKINALRNADLYHSCFSIFIGLDCPASELGFGEEALNLTRSDVNRADHVGGDPHQTIISVLSESERDATMAPPGKGSLTIHCPAYMSYESNWKTGPDFETGDAYNELKKKFADILLDRLEAGVAPGLRGHIQMMNIATPISYWRYTGNAQGTTSSLKPTGRNIRAGVARHKTPIKRLLVGGDWGEYGGGLPMAVKSGANASLIVLKDLKPDHFSELRNVLSGRSGA